MHVKAWRERPLRIGRSFCIGPLIFQVTRSQSGTQFYVRLGWGDRSVSAHIASVRWAL
jgi:hypothetical protein